MMGVIIFSAPCFAQGVQGHSFIWADTNKALPDFLAEGFELKSVVYDSSANMPAIFYFLQKGPSLVRCSTMTGVSTLFFCSIAKAD